MDPLSAYTGIEAAQQLWKLLKRFGFGDSEAKRLLDELADEFKGVPGFDPDALHSLSAQPAFLGLLLSVLVGVGDFDRADAQAICGQFIKSGDPSTTDEALVDRFINAIKRLAPKAGGSERRATEISHAVQLSAHDKTHAELAELRVLVQSLQATASPSVSASRVEAIAVADADVEATLQKARLANPDEVDILTRAIDAGGLDALRAAARDSGSWAYLGSTELLDLLGIVLSRSGAYGEAEVVFATLATREGVSDGARQLARAATMAHALGAIDRYGDLLDRARQADAGHFSVLMAETLTIEDPSEKLLVLEGLTPESDADRAAWELARSQCHLMLGNTDGAKANLDSALAADPDYPPLREFSAVYQLVVAGRRRAIGSGIDVAALREAVDRFIEFRDRLRHGGAYAGSAWMVARAAMGLAMLDRDEEGKAVLADLLPEEAAEAAPRLTLVEAAILLHDDGTADRLLSAATTQSDDERLVRLQIAVERGGNDAATAAQALSEFVASDDPSTAYRASLLLLAAAAADLDIDWDPDAEDVLREEDTAQADFLKYRRLLLTGDAESADTLALGYTNDPRFQRAMIDRARERGDAHQAVLMAQRLQEEHATPRDALLYAMAVQATGELAAATAAFLTLARAADTPTRLREEAFAGAAQTALDSQDYNELRIVAEEWWDATRSADAGWAKALALAQLARADEALTFVRGEGLNPDGVQRAELYAQLLYRAEKPDAAATEIAALSDRFEGRIEKVEALYLLACRDARDLSPDLVERRQKSWQSFSERFPDSTFVLHVATTIEELGELVRSKQEHSAELIAEAVIGVATGTTPLAVVSVVAGRPLIEVWWRLQTDGLLPLGYGDPSIAAVERSQADAALAGPAIWDLSSVYISGGVGVAEKALDALPGSVITQSSLVEIDLVAASPASESEGDLFYDTQTGAPRLRTWSDEDIARRKASAAGLLPIAHRLTVVPDVPPGAQDELAELARSDELSARRAIVSVILAARETRLPIYTDDRAVRRMAHNEGLPAFGTIALLDALHRRGRISDEDRFLARRRLVASGGKGLGLTPDEWTTLAQLGEGRLSLALRSALLDATSWLAVPLDMLHGSLVLLRVVHSAKPESLPVWVARVLNAARQSGAGARLPVASALIGFATRPSQPFAQEDAAFLRALIDAVRQAPRFGESVPDDPVLLALLHVAGAVAALGEPRRSDIILQVLGRLPVADQTRLIPIVFER